MHVISKRPFLEAIKKFLNDRSAIESTYSLLNRGKFESTDELKRVFKSLDNFKYKDKWWVIDIGGNNLRLLAFIEFRHKRVFVKHILTHAD